MGQNGNRSAISDSATQLAYGSCPRESRRCRGAPWGSSSTALPKSVRCARRNTIIALHFHFPRAWSAVPVGLGLAALVLNIGVPWMGGGAGKGRSTSADRHGNPLASVRPPLPSPNIVELVPPSVAVEVNAARPDYEGVIEASNGFRLPLTQPAAVTGRSAEQCLAQAVYYEAAGQSLAGQRAIAQVVLNRMRHPAFPKSVCGVVYQGSERRTGCQFTFTCDGSLARTPSRSGWDVADRIALAALSGAVEPAVGTATHYHADFVVPYWSSTLQKLVTIGNHIFYRYPGFWGSRRAFNGVYAGELQSLPTANLALTAAPYLEPPSGAGADSLARANLIFQPNANLVVKDGSLAAAAAPSRLRADEARGQLLADASQLAVPVGTLK